MVSSRIGRGFDRTVCNYLNSLGFLAVKSAGSKTPVDVIALPTPVSPLPNTLIVQCKAGESTDRISVTEWNALWHIASQDLAEIGSGGIIPLAAFRTGTGIPTFYRLLDELKPRTSYGRLRWEIFPLLAPR